MSTQTVKVRVVDAGAVRQGLRGGLSLAMPKGSEFDAHPAAAKILMESGAVEIVGGANSLRDATTPRPIRSGREFATTS